MTALIERALRGWRRAGVEVSAGTSAEDFRELELLVGAPVPSDLRALYEAANGMADFAHDHYLVSFWSIPRILREHEVQRGADERGEHIDIAFADVLLCSWFFWLRVRGQRVSVFVEAAAEELSDFSEFLRRYVETPESLMLAAAPEEKTDP